MKKRVTAAFLLNMNERGRERGVIFIAPTELVNCKYNEKICKTMYTMYIHQL